MTNKEFQILLDFEKDLKSVRILNQIRLEQDALFIRAKLIYPDEEMTVPFVYYTGKDWIFTPCDWQTGDLPTTANEIDRIDWRVNNTDQEGVCVNGVPALMFYQPEPVSARTVIGRMVREARVNAGLTTRELADKAGLNHAHISRIESGKYNLTIDTLDKISRVLGLEVALIPGNED